MIRLSRTLCCVFQRSQLETTEKARAKTEGDLAEAHQSYTTLQSRSEAVRQEAEKLARENAQLKEKLDDSIKEVANIKDGINALSAALKV